VLQVRIGSLHFPGLNESLEAARTRFELAVKTLPAGHSGNVLIVTHGDSIGAIVERLQPHCTVYQVDTAGFIMLQRSHSGVMVVEKATGVSWIE
jgi:broad specificity phosphatase PhoE